MTPPPVADENLTDEERWGLVEAIERPKHLPLIDAAGDFFGFVWNGIRGFRNVGNYTAEVLRQVGLLVSGSVLVIVFIAFIAGASCGIAAEAIGQAVGVGIAGPLFSSFCVGREVVPFIFGFIVAAKVGGGIVAQIGAMRVNEEVDAMEIMGIPAITYLVSTRMLASAVVMPIAYLLSLGAGMGAAWLASYVRSGTVSQGTWEQVFYTVTSLPDLGYSLIKGFVLAAAVIMVALYFGFRVRGGPVEVGTATAQSMAVNLILVTVLNMIMTFLFWGFDPGLPIRVTDDGTQPQVRLGPYAVRVAAIAALALGLVVLVLVVGASRERYEVHAVFDDVRGLIPGGDVTAGSLVVGSVTEVQLNEDGDPEVTMDIEGDVDLYQGAFADIQLSSNVGAVNRVVELTEGDPSMPRLEDGVVLSGKQTDNPVDFDLAVSTLKPKVRGEIKQILVGLDRAIRDRGTDVDRTLEHSSRALNETANLLAEANADGEALRTIVSEGQKVVSALASSPRDLGEAAERTAALLDVTARRQTELAEATRLLGPALSGGRRLLDRTAAAVPNLRELVAESGPLVAELGPFADLVPPATEAAGPFLQQTKQLVKETPGVLRLQKGLLRDAPSVVSRLVPLIDQLNPIADQLRVFTPETVGFFQNVADAAAPYDINGHMIRVASTAANGLPPSTAAGGEIGPSDCTPGLLAEPYHRMPGVNECEPWEQWRDSFIGGGG